MISYKKICLSFLLPILLPSAITTKATCQQNISQNLWQPRSFSSYRSREMIMLQDHKLRGNILSFAVEYMQNVTSTTSQLGSLPFWSGTNTMTIGTQDGKSDLDAYQFGLGDVLQTGSITLSPQVQHAGAEMLWRVAHTHDKPGPYFQIKIPLTAAMISLNIHENPATLSGEEDKEWIDYPSTPARYKTIQEALTSSFDHREPDLKFGRLHPGKDSVIRCGDIETSTGYHIFSSHKGYAGIGFKASLPTGNVPSAEFMLEPMVGRAGHWGIGGEIHGNYKVYESVDTTVHVSCRGEVLHLINGRRPNWRSFDLTQNGPGSKYLLLQRYIPIVAVAGSELVTNTLPQEIVPAINITTLPILTSFPAEGSLCAGFNMQRKHWNISILAEFWGRAQERIEIDNVELIKEKEENINDFVVLGRQIDRNSSSGEDLFYCEPFARIDKSAARQTTTTNSNPKQVKDARIAGNRIAASYKSALNISGAQAPTAYTGKTTFEIGYSWNKSDLTPHVSIYGGIEVANKSSKLVNLWSLGAQGSMTF